MSRFGRVAAMAVAATTIALGAFFTAPSKAEESAGTAAVPYTLHAATAPALGVLGQDNGDIVLPEAGVAEPALPAPVADHAVATIEPAPVDDPSDQAAVRSRSLSQLVAEYSSSEVSDSELECLAGAIYFESKGEPLAGQLTVAEVIINRANSGRFPSTLCGVVKQRGQFSFIRAGRFPPIPRSSAQWRTAVAIAQIARQELASGAAPRALFFHARRVSPGWRLTRVGIVGNHVFYR